MGSFVQLTDNDTKQKGKTGTARTT